MSTKRPTIEDVARVVCAVSGKPTLSPELVQALANERGEPIDYLGVTYEPQPKDLKREREDRDHVTRMVERSMMSRRR